MVVLGTAGILYSPVRNSSPAIASVAPVEKTSKSASSGWTNYPDVQPPVPVAPAETSAQKVSDMIVLADNTTVYNIPRNSDSGSATTIDLNALKNGYISEESAAASQPQSQNINITVNVPEPKEAPAAPSAPPAPAYEEPKPAPAASAAVAKAPRKDSAPAKESKPAKAASSAPVPAKSESVKSSSNVKVTVNGNASVTVKEEPKKTQFWVQVAAYSNKKGAENARSILDTNKIPADVFTYQDNKSRLFYRVRVGPYTTKSEAEYWRSRIVKIDDFAKAESYITSTTN